MAGIDYQKLYKLQDKVLEIVFSVEKEFYLTGGTCLNRFYHEKRYSDDLDFFTNNSSRYNFAVKNIRTALDAKFKLDNVVETKSFVRFMIDDFLQLDFVNDISVRYKDVCVTGNDYLIDNIENILGNKLTAVIGRDNPKDVFDIYLICKFHSFSWKEIIISAKEKVNFSNEDLIIRLQSFPVILFDSIKLIDEQFLNDFDGYFPKIIDEIVNQSHHLAFDNSDE